MDFDAMRPFLRRDALAYGLRHSELRGPRYRHLMRNVYVSSGVPESPVLLAQAALMVHPAGAVVTHTSAARVYGAPVPNDARVHVTVARAEDRRFRTGLRCHVLQIPQDDVVVRHGLRLSSPRRVFVELASMLSLVDLVIVGDWFVRHGHLTTNSLLRYCEQVNAQHRAHARRAASYVRDLVDSPMETRVRMLILLGGLPEPEVNGVVRHSDGRVLLRHDLLYRKAKLAIEYDGRVHVEVLDKWQDDAERRDLVPDDWRVLTVTSRGVFQEPAKTLDRIWRALRARGFRGLPKVSDAWRMHFGG